MKKLKVIFLVSVIIGSLAPVQAQVNFTASATSGCSPLAVKLSIDPATVDMDTISSAEWHISVIDSVINSVDPDTLYLNTDGEYDVLLFINGNMQDTVKKENYITVHHTVSAAFRYEEYRSNYNYRFIPLAPITDSTATYFYMWRYRKAQPGFERSNDKIVTINNQLNAIDTAVLDTGVYYVTLRIEDTYGCISSYSDSVLNFEEILLPNVFAPRDESDFYIIDPQSASTVLQIQIFNRYGGLVFKQTAPIINWNGKTNTGFSLTTGVYYYILESVEGDPNGLYNKTGFIHLYRYFD